MNNIRFEDEWDEMCPIYLDNEGIFEQIGTGVLINIFENIYLLTASHVIDELYRFKGANLLIPTVDGFDRIAGTLYHRHLKENENRDDDKIDFSFYKLSSEMIKDLHENLIPLIENQIDFSNDFTVNINKSKKLMHDKEVPKVMKKVYSKKSSISMETINAMNDKLCNTTIIFAGYPNTKSNYQNDIHQTEIVYYHGMALSSEEYITNNYDKTLNILAEHGKYGVMDKDFNSKNSPKPQGISGGGVYKIIKTDKGFDRELIGIGHTYKKQKHLFVGTNINYCINIIKRYAY